MAAGGVHALGGAGSGRILVFDDGHIVQDGAYDDLAAQDGLFRDMLTSAAFTDVR